MGILDDLFGGDKKIKVASQAYNLAGDEALRPNFLKTLILQNVLSDTKNSITNTISSGYLHGAGISFRSFFRWANRNYDLIGMPTGKLDVNSSVDLQVVEDNIPAGPGETIWVQDGDIDNADYSKWVEQYLLANYPDELDNDWESDIDEDTDLITITFEDNSVHTFTPIDYNARADYLYAYYNVEIAGVLGPIQLFIYRIGSGGIPAIDAAIFEKTSYGKFFPFMPIRIYKNFLSESYKPAAFELVEDAYFKAFGAQVSDLIDMIKDNNDKLSDIDFGYVVFGVALNTKEKFCQKYLWNFFLKLMAQQEGGAGIYTAWLINRNGALSASETWKIWKEAQSHPSDPLYGTPEPSKTAGRSLTDVGNQLKITNSGPSNTNYDIRLKWTYISTGAGPGRIGDHENDTYWFEYLGEDTFASTIVSGGPNANLPPGVIEKIRLYHQISGAEGYEYQDIVGLVHKNIVYKNKSVKTTAKQGLMGQDVETGFIIPLQYETFHDMRLVDSTQMATSCVFIVFNVYEKFKIPWYATGLFKIFFVIVIAIAAALVTGGLGIGILGTNIAVGSSLGFTGVTAAIIGSVTNALAAVALSSVITYGAKSLLGDTLGSIVGVLASILSMQVLTTFSLTGSLSINWSQLMSVDNILKLTDSLTQSYAAYVQGNIEDMSTKLDDYVSKSEDFIKETQQKLYNEFGYGIGLIDPLKLMEARNLIVESRDTFLQRTLMTGSDIADMSNGMLTDFASLTLTLPNPYTTT